jgi:hypothetical protein
MLIVDYSLTLGLICFFGIRERALCMTRSLHILLCLMALLRFSGVSSECEYQCCSDALDAHSSSCGFEECRATIPQTKSSSVPCDQQCCGTLDGITLQNVAGVEESLESVASSPVVDCQSPLADVRSQLKPSSQPRSPGKTHLLVCVFLC